jgi:opacity protein-like surface antigen
MEQYNWTMALRYSFVRDLMKNVIRPVLGGLASYTYRSYSIPYSPYDQEVKSNALDLGVLVGVDFVLSRQFSVGLDYRWMTNIESRYGDNYILNLGGAPRIEDADYDSFGLSLRYEF